MHNFYFSRIVVFMKKYFFLIPTLNCQKICSWWRRPKTKLEFRKRPHFSRLSRSLHYFQVFQTSKAVVFSCRPFFASFLKSWNTNENFQQNGKQDSFKYILKCSANMHKSSGSEFFRSTAGIHAKGSLYLHKLQDHAYE